MNGPNAGMPTLTPALSPAMQPYETRCDEPRRSLGLKNNRGPVSRGHIKLLDRAKLQKRVCECYGIVKKEYDRLLPYEVPCQAASSSS